MKCCPHCGTSLVQSRGEIIEAEGKSQSISAWGRELGLAHTTISRRLKAGMTIHQALFTPVRKKTEKKEKPMAMGERKDSLPMAVRHAQVMGAKPYVAGDWFSASTMAVFTGMTASLVGYVLRDMMQEGKVSTHLVDDRPMYRRRDDVRRWLSLPWRGSKIPEDGEHTPGWC